MLLNDERPCISIQLVLERDISPTGWACSSLMIALMLLLQIVLICVL